MDLDGVDEDNQAAFESFRNSAEMEASMRKRFQPKRALAHLSWTLAEGMQIAVRV
jgi:hypothetical protein